MVQYGAFKIKSIVVKAEFSNPEAIKKKNDLPNRMLIVQLKLS